MNSTVGDKYGNEGERMWVWEVWSLSPLLVERAVKLRFREAWSDQPRTTSTINFWIRCWKGRCCKYAIISQKNRILLFTEHLRAFPAPDAPDACTVKAYFKVAWAASMYIWAPTSPSIVSSALESIIQIISKVDSTTGRASDSKTVCLLSCQTLKTKLTGRPSEPVVANKSQLLCHEPAVREANREVIEDA